MKKCDCCGELFDIEEIIIEPIVNNKTKELITNYEVCVVCKIEHDKLNGVNK